MSSLRFNHEEECARARGSVEEIPRGGINFRIPLKREVSEFLPRYRARRALPDGITGLARCKAESLEAM